MKKKILFFYKQISFKNYIKKNDSEMFKKSVFLKDCFKKNKDKIKYEDVEVISVFINIKLMKDRLILFPNLKTIVTRSTGTDHIDKIYCKKHNIEIFNVPEYGSRTVAEFALTSLLYLLKNFELFKSGNFREQDRGYDLKGKTIGVIGAGSIGKNFIKLRSNFDTKILVSDPVEDKIFSKKYDANYVDLNILLTQSDIISIHAPLCNSTRHLLKNKEFNLMKDNVTLINTARGAIIDTKALYKNLRNGKIFKAGLDVLEQEQNLKLRCTKNLTKTQKEILELNKKIIKMKKIVFTHHQGYNTYEAVERIWEVALKHLQNYKI